MQILELIISIADFFIDQIQKLNQVVVRIVK